ncbi:MAG: hypothetical protein FJY86_01645 [Candidatus Diapherotrites archaeon]|uniref:Uncharacterized protein n=1 Tax=Candidatus Iainarchaeum sp. TaxID=3101447 RepID=A0A8T4C6W1_9ARCH|nr:hypothetical protein [Candidatus Diapherotrites archaeon]
MHAIVEVESLSQDWKPPFAKKRETKSFTVSEGEVIELLKDGSPLFTIKSIQGDRILLGYSRMYTLKGYEHPTERQLWLAMHEAKKFSSLWEDNGITKTVTLRSVKMSDGEVPVAPSTQVSDSDKGMASRSNADTEIYRPSQ